MKMMDGKKFKDAASVLQHILKDVSSMKSNQGFTPRNSSDYLNNGTIRAGVWKDGKHRCGIVYAKDYPSFRDAEKAAKELALSKF